ncbi:MAG TPA: hypothetical protein VNJ02_01005 [Vicinamibacterales bacterium]|nr:hypothetical protein [Vicinamibacterales bacterium]
MLVTLGGVALLIALVSATGLTTVRADQAKPASGPSQPSEDPNKHETGDARAGRDVFRSETFGNEAFWTDAVRLPQGVMAAKFTPIDALKAGYHVNVDALDDKTKAALAAELKTDLSPARAPMLNDPRTTAALVNANAVIGVVAKDTNRDGRIDITAGDKMGVACAFCHAITDGSVYSMPKGGSIGKQVDGPTPHFLNVGATFAIAANTRALYPIAQLALTANKGQTIGRAPTGLTENSTEAEIDAYFNNPKFYPVGMFDDGFDGNGAPMHMTPMFEAELAAPWGSEAAISKLDNFSNLVYTGLLDLTGITTPGGRAFLHKLGGAAGDEIVEDYVKILAATNVTGYPYAQVSTKTTPGDERGPLGIRVDNKKLLDMNAYLNDLEAPKGMAIDNATKDRAEKVFRTSCTTCHNLDQDTRVGPMIVPMEQIFPGDNPVILAQREPPLNPVQNTVNSFFDDKMVVVNASIRKLERGIAIPLLLDLARKPAFLHDDTVSDLDMLLNPSRGPNAPHPFYLSSPEQRKDMVALLKSLSAK